MKKILFLNRISAFLIAILMLEGCTTYSYLKVPIPPKIKLPDEIAKVALMGRFVPEDGKWVLNLLEGVATREKRHRDNQNAHACLESLAIQLTSARFVVTQPPVELQGNGGFKFPPALSADTVRQICLQIGVAALITLDEYDTDVNTSEYKKPRQYTNSQGVVMKDTVWVATRTTTARLGWRIYLADSGQLFNEYRQPFSIPQTFEAPTKVAAMDGLGLPPTPFALFQSATKEYGSNFFPTEKNFSRVYYKVGSEYFKEGHQYMKRNDLSGAEKQWILALDEGKRRILGRAKWNLAVAAEFRGDFEEALRLVGEARDEYHLSGTNYYTVSLKKQLEDQKKIKQTTNPPEKSN